MFSSLLHLTVALGPLLNRGLGVTKRSRERLQSRTREPRTIDSIRFTRWCIIEDMGEMSMSEADKVMGVPRVGIGVVVLNDKQQVLIGKRKSRHGQGKLRSEHSQLII